MKKLFFYTMIILLFAFKAQADLKCPDGTVEGENCWRCGTDCTAYLSDDLINKNGNKQLNITGSGAMYNYSYSDRSARGYGVINTTNAPWFSNESNITHVSIDGISYIGQSAFSALNHVKSIDIGDSVTSFGQFAFNTMEALESARIPSSVTSSGYWVFAHDINLKNLIIEGTPNLDSIVTDTTNNIKVYCLNTVSCPNLGNRTIIFSKDENDVYNINGVYYASPENMISQTSCGTGSSAPQNCIREAANYQMLKKHNMIQNTDGSYTIFDKNGKIIGFKGKRIYTVEEASMIASKKGNTFTLKYR